MEKGLNILLKTYLLSAGLKSKTIPKEDFDIARQEGYMFDYPKCETHDEALKRLDVLVSKISPHDAANAFLYSLSTRKLEYRSILGSYYYAKAVPAHELYRGHNLTWNYDSSFCYLCDWKKWHKAPDEGDLYYGLNILNYQRYKWGGIRHTQLNYALFDLEQFLKLPKVTPSDEDKEILKNILACVKKLENNGKAGKLRDSIYAEKLLKCSKREIDVILNILGICGILANKEFPSYEDKFVDAYHRDPVEHKNDFDYPVNRWRASDGINYDKFEQVFQYKVHN